MKMGRGKLSGFLTGQSNIKYKKDHLSLIREWQLNQVVKLDGLLSLIVQNCHSAVPDRNKNFKLKIILILVRRGRLALGYDK
jgi:hypothetical protein